MLAKKWEYKKEIFRNGIDEELLSKFGNEGWEIIVYINRGKAGLEIIFKREKV